MSFLSSRIRAFHIKCVFLQQKRTSDVISVSPFCFYSNVISFTNPIPLVAVCIPRWSRWAPPRHCAHSLYQSGPGSPTPLPPSLLASHISWAAKLRHLAQNFFPRPHLPEAELAGCLAVPLRALSSTHPRPLPFLPRACPFLLPRLFTPGAPRRSFRFSGGEAFESQRSELGSFTLSCPHILMAQSLR